MNKSHEFELKYSHNIIEHLGLKLYQNKPTNVLAELVSNSWDADAENVWIDIKKNSIAVCDNGLGMSRIVLSENYLVIGKKKRTIENISELTQKNRKMMGRKGIGKLAPFGIAQKLSLLTVDKSNKKCYWIEINLNSLLKESEGKEHHDFSYKPRIICNGVSVTDIPLEEDKYDYVKNSISKIKNGGTLIIMDHLSLKREISQEQLSQSIGQRFTVTLLRSDFKVNINGKEVTDKNALPSFIYRIPKNGGMNTEFININGEQREIRYWAGFVEKADWPQDQAGVGVYTHGKIAQDRPFVFGLKGREISTRYMYGVIEADWLDELEEDIVSTDRTSINWENDATEPLYTWGNELVAKWVNEYRKFQKHENEGKIIEKINTLPNIPKITNEEKNTIKEMVCSMSPKIYKDDGLQNEVIEKLTSAWTHRPTRNIIRTLWDRLEKSEKNENEFIKTLHDIHKHLVPESLSLSVTVAQKIYALSCLNELSINGTEQQLQALLEAFPWILGSDKGKVYANKSLKELAKKAASEGSLPAHGYTKTQLEEISNSPDSTTRPDFSFFSDENKGVIIIVELKSPLIPLEYSHLMQLLTYFYWLKGIYPNAKISGYLIGKNPSNAVTTGDPSIEIMTWDKVCLQSRKDYLELLSAMLQGIPEHYDDARIHDVFEFGGEPTRELLKRMANADSPLSDFFVKIDKKLER